MHIYNAIRWQHSSPEWHFQLGSISSWRSTSLMSHTVSWQPLNFPLSPATVSKAASTHIKWYAWRSISLPSTIPLTEWADALMLLLPCFLCLSVCVCVWSNDLFLTCFTQFYIMPFVNYINREEKTILD